MMKNAEKIINVALEDIVPYENNPRRNDDAVEYVVNSIKSFGFKVPIIIDKYNVIVCGHTRYKAAIKLGMREVPCIVADDLSESEIRALRIADNSTAEQSFWDYSALDEELAQLTDINMEDFGIGGTLIDDYGGNSDEDITFKDEEDVETKNKCPKCGYEW